MDILLIGENGTSYSIANGTRAITLIGLPAITSKNLLYIYNITQDKLYFSPTETLSNATVSGGNTINVAASFPVLADTDALHMQVTLGEMAYDITVDANKDLIMNPDYSYRTSPELIGFTNQAAGTYYYPIPWDTYKHGSMFATAATGAGNTLTWTLWATNKYDADLVTVSELEWKDVTNALTGAASYTVAAATANQEEFHWLDNNICVEYLMLKVVVVDGGTPDNSLGIYVKKSY